MSPEIFKSDSHGRIDRHGSKSESQHFSGPDETEAQKKHGEEKSNSESQSFPAEVAPVEVEVASVELAPVEKPEPPPMMLTMMLPQIEARRSQLNAPTYVSEALDNLLAAFKRWQEESQ